MKNLLRTGALAGALLALAVPMTPAQCLGDDGFNTGTCCLPANPVLPHFPPATIKSQGCCFLNCDVESTFNVNIQMAAPAQVMCDLFLVPIVISGSTVTTNFTWMVAKYQRTWTETDAGGVTNRQVWRFLVNADLYYQTVSPTPCPIPPCAGAAGADNPVHFMGSLDYALDCTTGVFETSINLTHLCETFMHGSWSTRPLSAPDSHPERTYCFVGPRPFAFGLDLIPDGPVFAEAQRSTYIDISSGALTWTCYGENPIINGSLDTVSQDCLCSPLVPGTAQWTHQKLWFDFVCPPNTYTFNSIGMSALLPAGMAAMSIGRYAIPANQYPWDEAISLYIGVAVSPEPCATAAWWPPPFHIVTGVGTVGGDASTLFSGMIANEFLDLQNMLIITGTNPPLNIGIGSLFVSTQSWQLNTQ